MLDTDALFADLDEIGLQTWQAALAPLLRERLSDTAHGDLSGWKDIVNQLPSATEPSFTVERGTVVINTGSVTPDSVEYTRALLQRLMPWRKGPFRIDGIELDTEWRSNLKWQRIHRAIRPLSGRSVLDVGSGNGYYAFRMQRDGATRVVGIDPTILFVCQFHALKKMSGASRMHVLPLRLHELPPRPNAFDTTFSMGVLYHQRDPHEHLAQLRDTLRPGGELVLETLVLPGDSLTPLQPESRYARMRNVWSLPTIPLLGSWLEDAGLQQISVVDISKTTVDEQRSTEWMPFESLAESLDPVDPTLTIEGLPAPTRVVLTCRTGE